jgi:hypothetical protein
MATNLRAFVYCPLMNNSHDFILKDYHPHVVFFDLHFRRLSAAPLVMLDHPA